MDPKWSQNGGKISGASFPGGIRKRFGNTDSFLWFWDAFGPLLAPFSTPFGHPGSLSASLREPFGLPEAVLSAAFGSF